MDNNRDTGGFGIFDGTQDDVQDTGVIEGIDQDKIDKTYNGLNRSIKDMKFDQDDSGQVEDDQNINDKFNEIAHNVAIQSSANIGTQRIKIPETQFDISRPSDTIRYSEKPSERTPENEEEHLDKDDEQRRLSEAKYVFHSILCMIIVGLSCVVFTYVFCRFTESTTSTHNKIENQKLTATVSELKEQLSDKDKEIQGLLGQDKLDEEEKEQLRSEIDAAKIENDELQDEIDTLNNKLAETENELKEQRFRADMFQKYGPQWER